MRDMDRHVPTDDALIAVHIAAFRAGLKLGITSTNPNLPVDQIWARVDNAMPLMLRDWHGRADLLREIKSILKQYGVIPSASTPTER